MAKVISPLTRIDKIYTFRDYIVQAINEQLDVATTATDIMGILRQVHGNQLNDAASYKERVFKMLQDHEQEVLTRAGKDNVEEFRQYKEQQVAEENSTTQVDDNFEKLSTFEPMGDADLNNFTETSQDNVFGDFGGDNGFGGISLDMLDETNKNEATENLSDQQEMFNTDGYIDKQDYYDGKKYSDKNNESNQAWLTDNDNLFDPDKAEAEQIEEHPDYNPNGTPELDENGSPLVKYKRKEKHKDAEAVEDTDTTGKSVAWLSYILFFLPLLFAGKQSFVRHHANQGLIINILDVLCAVLIGAKFFVTAEGILLTVLQVAMFVGIFIEVMILPSRLALLISSLFGKRKRLPILGKINMIK